LKKEKKVETSIQRDNRRRKENSETLQRKESRKARKKPSRKCPMRSAREGHGRGKGGSNEQKKIQEDNSNSADKQNVQRGRCQKGAPVKKKDRLRSQSKETAQYGVKHTTWSEIRKVRLNETGRRAARVVGIKKGGFSVKKEGSGENTQGRNKQGWLKGRG